MRYQVYFTPKPDDPEVGRLEFENPGDDKDIRATEAIEVMDRFKGTEVIRVDTTTSVLFIPTNDLPYKIKLVKPPYEPSDVQAELDAYVRARCCPDKVVFYERRGANGERKLGLDGLYLSFTDQNGSYAAGFFLPYFPGKTLDDLIDELCPSRERASDHASTLSLHDKLSRVLLYYDNVLDVYEKLYRECSILPLDISLRNVVVKVTDSHSLEFQPIDFADYLDNTNAYMTENRSRHTFGSMETENLLRSRRQQVNQRFFYALHEMLLGSLRKIYESNQIQLHDCKLLDALGPNFIPDLIPESSHHSSTGQLFACYKNVLRELMLLHEGQAVDSASTEEATPEVGIVLWNKIQAMKRCLEKISKRLEKHTDSEGLRQSIQGYITQIPREAPGYIGTVPLYQQGLMLFLKLNEAEKIAEHRQACEYRGKGSRSVLTMSAGQRAAIVFAGLVVFGLIALLILYIIAQWKTASQKIIESMTRSLVGLRLENKVSNPSVSNRKGGLTASASSHGRSSDAPATVFNR